MRVVKLILVFVMAVSCSFIIGYKQKTNATFIAAATTEQYTDPLYGYDVNAKYYIVQTDSFQFSGYDAGFWPSGRTITYTPYKTNYSVAAAGVIMSGVYTSANIYYNKGCAYLANYRVGAHTNTGTANSYFQFFV